TAWNVRFEDRPQKLGVPGIAFIVRDAILLGILAGNVARAENHVPQEKHVAEVAFVISDPIVRSRCVVRMMSSRSRDDSLNDPGNRVESLIVIERFVPGNT